MKLTKFAHACVRLERDGKVLVLDPGTFSEAGKALTGADAVLITHEHADHLDIPAVVAALMANPALFVHAPAAVAVNLRSQAPDAEARIIDATPGSTFEAAGFAIRCFGGQHALIHPQVPLVANIGYLVDGRLYHPGDSFVVPDGVTVQALLLPIHAPWSKSADVIDFMISVGAPKAFQIHDALLSDVGVTVVESHLKSMGARYGTEYTHLATGDSVEI